MVCRETTIINRLGLHARAAAQLVRMANEYPCTITLNKDGQLAGAKTIMEVLMLGATQHTKISITADGDQEQEAVDAIVALIEARFNELE